MIHGYQNRQSRSLNLRDAIITLIPVTAVLGSNVLQMNLHFLHLFAYRDIVMLGLFYFIVNKLRIRLYADRPFKAYTLLNVCFIVWGVMSILWSPNTSAAINQILVVFTGYLTGLLIYNLNAGKRSILPLVRGWTLAYTVAASVALWEITTGHHLHSYYMEHQTMLGAAMDKSLVLSTFQNPNDYAAFIILTVPFLLVFLSRAKGVKRIFSSLLLVSAPILLVLTQGRLATIGFVFQMLIWLFRSLSNKRSLLLMVGLVIGISCAFLITLKVDPYSVNKINMLWNGQSTGSTGIRWNLTLDGISFAFHSMFMGIGAGGFESVVQSGLAPYPTWPIVDPHNFWTEVLSEYGIVVFSVLIWWFVSVIRLALVSVKRTDRLMQENMDIQLIIILGLVGYIPAAVEDSSYVNDPLNWIFIGSLAVLASVLYRSSGRTHVESVGFVSSEESQTEYPTYPHHRVAIKRL